MNQRFLIVNPFGIGDVIFSLASAQRLREVYPDSLIGFVGNERTAELLLLAGCVNRVYVFNRDFLRSALNKSPFLFLKELQALYSSVALEKYDTLIDFSLGREFSTMAFLLGIPKRVGFDYKGRGFFLTHKKKIRSYAGIPVAQAQLDLLLEKNILPDNRMPSEIEIGVPEIVMGLKSGGKVLAVAPGGGRSWGGNAPYKQWDPEKFAEVINALWILDPEMRVVLLGDTAERELLASVGAQLTKRPDLLLAGESIAKVCAVLKKSNLLLCNDGGLMHLAHVLGTKTVAIFGPVDEKVYGPYGGNIDKRILTHTVACRPCYQDFHFPQCHFHRQCLSGLGAHKVIEAIKEIL